MVPTTEVELDGVAIRLLAGNAGTSGATEPDWATGLTAIGDTIVDGTITWTAVEAGKIPFYIDPGTGLVVIDGAAMRDASIDNAKIGSLAADKIFVASGTIAQALIGTADISSAMIANAAITTAKIGSAQIDTLRLQNNAVILASSTTASQNQYNDTAFVALTFVYNHGFPGSVPVAFFVHDSTYVNAQRIDTGDVTEYYEIRPAFRISINNGAQFYPGENRILGQGNYTIRVHYSMSVPPNTFNDYNLTVLGSVSLSAIGMKR